MSTIEPELLTPQSLIDVLCSQAEDGRPHTLDGFDPTRVAPLAGQVAESPVAPLLAEALCTSAQQDLQVWLPSIHQFVAGLGRQDRLLALADSIDCLFNARDAIMAVADSLSKVMICDLDTLTCSNPYIASCRLECLVRLALADLVKPWRIIDFATSDHAEAGDGFAERLPRLVGALHDKWANEATFARSLEDALLRLIERDACRADAAFEHALIQLRAALSAPSLPDALDGLHRARASFAAVEAEEEGRDDALAFGAACDGVIAFSRSDSKSLQSAVIELSSCVYRRTYNNFGMHQSSWLRPRYEGEVCWGALLMQLRNVNAALVDDRWLNASETLGLVSRVYLAHRTTYPLHADVVVQPVIENAFIENAHMLGLLERYIEQLCEFPEPSWPADEARQLLSQIKRRTRERAQSNQQCVADQDDVEGYLSRVYRVAPAIATSMDPKVVADIGASNLTDDILFRMGGLVYANQYKTAKMANSYSIRQFDRILKELRADSDFGGDIEICFEILLKATIEFLSQRLDVGSSILSRVDYRKAFKPNEPVPKEASLQEDFRSWLAAVLGKQVTVEVPGISLGRTDIHVTFGDIRFIIEVKRELSDSSPTAVERNFIIQAAEYQVANVPFGILLVLDLTPHTLGTPSLADSLWLVRHRPTTWSRERNVVVVIVPGNRQSPSKIVR